jgi:predicted dehydrogenase
MLKMAIVGAGVWGETHAGIFVEHPGVVNVAVCDMNLDRAKTVAKKYGIKDVYTDYKEMLRKADCDAVSIVTPDHLHADIAIGCAKAGKDMLIEKPIATTRDDVHRIVDAANKHKVRVMVDLHNRWNPPFVTAKQAIDAGELGELQTGYIRLNDIKWVATDMLSWTAQSSILWFLGSHSLDTLRWMFNDDVKRVYSVSRRGVMDALGVPATDTYLTTLEFAGGAIAQMENAWITPNGNPNLNDFKFNILGSKGMVAIDASNHNLIQKYTDEKTIVPDILVRNSVHGRVKGFAYESIRCFADKIISGEDFIVSMEDAAKTSLAILSIIKSAESGMPVDVEY